MAKSRTQSKAKRSAASAGAPAAESAKAASPTKRAKAKVGRPAHPPHVRRKNLFVDQERLDRVRAALGTATETETVDEALARVDRRKRVADAIMQVVAIMRQDRVWSRDPAHVDEPAPRSERQRTR